MNIISLPPVLPGELNLEQLNYRLLTGGAMLDWTAIKEVSLAQLRVLLAGLDLVEHSEVLGIATVPDTLAETILHILSAQKQQRGHGHGHVKSDSAIPAPVTSEAGQDPTQNGITDAPCEPQQPPVKKAPSEVPRPFLQPPSASALRDELERLVLLDLLGPAGGPEEELDENSVRERYLVGMLAPRDQQIAPEELDELAIPEEGGGVAEDGLNDETRLQTATLFPSSIGLSFCVDGTARELLVTARWGYYRRERSETLKSAKGSAKTVWKRQQMGGEPKILPLLKVGALQPWQVIRPKRCDSKRAWYRTTMCRRPNPLPAQRFQGCLTWCWT